MRLPEMHTHIIQDRGRERMDHTMRIPHEVNERVSYLDPPPSPHHEERRKESHRHLSRKKVFILSSSYHRPCLFNDLGDGDR